MYEPGQQPGYAPSQYHQYAQAPAQQPRLAYEQQQVPQLGQLMQHFAQTQQQNLGMVSMNGMGRSGMITGMQNVQNMQHRYPWERERERERQREKARTRDSGGMEGGDIGGYRRDNHGQNVQGSSKRTIEINKQITVCEDSRDLSALIDAHAAEFNHVVTAPHTCLSYEHANMRQFDLRMTLMKLTERGECLSKAPAELARWGALQRRGASNAGARRSGPADH